MKNETMPKNAETAQTAKAAVAATLKVRSALKAGGLEHSHGDGTG